MTRCLCLGPYVAFRLLVSSLSSSVLSLGATGEAYWARILQDSDSKAGAPAGIGCALGQLILRPLSSALAASTLPSRSEFSAVHA
jgi:hypothetical protein